MAAVFRLIAGLPTPPSRLRVPDRRAANHACCAKSRRSQRLSRMTGLGPQADWPVLAAAALQPTPSRTFEQMLRLPKKRTRFTGAGIATMSSDLEQSQCNHVKLAGSPMRT